MLLVISIMLIVVISYIFGHIFVNESFIITSYTNYGRNYAHNYT